MSVKNLIVLAAAGIATVGATAFAGGPDQMPAAPMFQPNVYVEGNVGYVQSNWNNYLSNNPTGAPVSTFGTAGDNNAGGFTFGFALGYNFIKHFSAELGWDWIPQAQGFGRNAVTGAASGQALNVQSWVIYLDGKLDVPVSDNFALFGKLGAAYRQLQWGGAAAGGTGFQPGGTVGYWSPHFGAGGQYMFTDNFYGDVQWKHVMANTNAGPSRAAPTANFYTAGIGYKFAV